MRIETAANGRQVAFFTFEIAMDLELAEFETGVAPEDWSAKDADAVAEMVRATFERADSDDFFPMVRPVDPTDPMVHDYSGAHREL